MSRYQSCSPGMYTLRILISFSSSTPRSSSSTLPSWARSPPKIRKAAGGLIACTSFAARTVLSTKRVFSERVYRWVSEIHANLNGASAAWATSMVLISGHQEKVSATVAAPSTQERWMKVRRVSFTEGSGRSPGCCSSVAISRRALSSSDMEFSPPNSRWIQWLRGVVFPFAATERAALGRLFPVRFFQPVCALFLLQLDCQIGRLTGGDDHRLLCRSCERLHRDQCVVAGWHVRNGEFAVGAGHRVIRIVRHVDPSLHPAMGVAIDANGAGPFEFGWNALTLIRQRQIEGSSLVVIAMGVVQNRIAVDDVQPARPDHLNFRRKRAFDIVEFGGFVAGGAKLCPCEQHPNDLQCFHWFFMDPAGPPGPPRGTPDAGTSYHGCVSRLPACR